MTTGQCVFDLRIEDLVQGEVGPIDAGITSVARECYLSWVECPYGALILATLSRSVSPDSKLVAAGSLDTVVRVWSTVTGQQIERLRGHQDSVYR